MNHFYVIVPTKQKPVQIKQKTEAPECSMRPLWCVAFKFLRLRIISSRARAQTAAQHELRVQRLGTLDLNPCVERVSGVPPQRTVYFRKTLI